MSTRDEALRRHRALYGPILDAAAARHKVDPALLRAVAYVESRFNPSAIGPACGVAKERARGILQLMPVVCRDLNVSDPHDAEQCAEGGARLLARHLKRYGGDEVLALAAYNWGRGNVDDLGARMLGQHPGTSLPKQVRAYVNRVLTRRAIEAK